MSNAEMMERIVMASPRLRARFVASYYLLTILTGAFLLFFHGRLAFAADLIASVCYLAVTALFYDLSKPVNRSLFCSRRSSTSWHAPLGNSAFMLPEGSLTLGPLIAIWATETNRSPSRRGRVTKGRKTPSPLLLLHIIGGTLGILSGFAAVFLRKVPAGMGWLETCSSFPC